MNECMVLNFVIEKFLNDEYSMTKIKIKKQSWSKLCPTKMIFYMIKSMIKQSLDANNR